MAFLRSQFQQHTLLGAFPQDRGISTSDRVTTFACTSAGTAAGATLSSTHRYTVSVNYLSAEGRPFLIAFVSSAAGSGACLMHEWVVTAPRTIFPFQGRIPALLLQVSLFFQKKNAACQGSQSCLDKDLECEALTFIPPPHLRRDSSLSSLLA